MSLTARVLIVIITILVTLEGLFVCLWPRQVKKWVRLGTPAQLRGAGCVEFLIGLSVFIYCFYKL
jgi:uncharacterized protein YjeT (DUF2065 family)